MLRRWAVPLTFLSFFGTPEVVTPFRDTGYVERLADPGVVDAACYGDGRGFMDDGRRKSWDDSYCGCVDFRTRTVHIARRLGCDAERVRDHEECHIETGPSREARAECAKRFPAPRS